MRAVHTVEEQALAIVENFGLSWGTQGPKLSENKDRFGYLLIKIPTKIVAQDEGN